MSAALERWAHRGEDWARQDPAAALDLLSALLKDAPAPIPGAARGVWNSLLAAAVAFNARSTPLSSSEQKLWDAAVALATQTTPLWALGLDVGKEVVAGCLVHDQAPLLSAALAAPGAPSVADLGWFDPGPDTFSPIAQAVLARVGHPSALGIALIAWDHRPLSPQPRSLDALIAAGATLDTPVCEHGASAWALVRSQGPREWLLSRGVPLLTTPAQAPDVAAGLIGPWENGSSVEQTIAQLKMHPSRPAGQEEAFLALARALAAAWSARLRHPKYMGRGDETHADGLSRTVFRCLRRWGLPKEEILAACVDQAQALLSETRRPSPHLETLWAPSQWIDCAFPPGGTPRHIPGVAGACLILAQSAAVNDNKSASVSALGLASIRNLVGASACLSALEAVPAAVRSVGGSGAAWRGWDRLLASTLPASVPVSWVRTIDVWAEGAITLSIEGARARRSVCASLLKLPVSAALPAAERAALGFLARHRGPAWASCVPEGQLLGLADVDRLEAFARAVVRAQSRTGLEAADATVIAQWREAALAAQLPAAVASPRPRV